MPFVEALLEEHVAQTSEESEETVAVAAIEEPALSEAPVEVPAAAPDLSPEPPTQEERPAAPRPPKGSKPKAAGETPMVQPTAEAEAPEGSSRAGNIIWGITGLLALVTFGTWRRERVAAGAGYGSDDDISPEAISAGPY